MTVTLGVWNDQSITLSIKKSSLTISLSGNPSPVVVSYDYEGRFWTAMLDNISYRRGLDGKIIAKWMDINQLRYRRWLTKMESEAIEHTTTSLAKKFLDAYNHNIIKTATPVPPLAINLLERASSYSSDKSREDIQHYHQVYKPVGILPPDQYFSVVLQATEGCSFNSCTFCTFYKDRPFHIKTPGEFQTHITRVKHFLGDGLSLRKTIFIGDANALVIPMGQLVPLMDIIHDYLNVDELGGIFAFLDGFSGEKKTPADYSLLSRLGLKRVYIGMESGNAELLDLIQKPGNPEDVIDAVASLKAGGIAVGIIILLGAGGRHFYQKHVEDSVAAINQMKLGLDDILYFSELIEDVGMRYTLDAYEKNLGLLSPQQRLEQAQDIESQLVFSDNGDTPHISRYDIREFIY